MKKYSKIFVILILFVLCPKGVKAMLCENEDKVRWQTLAQNVTISYDAIEKNGEVEFSVTFSNLVEGLIIVDNNTSKEYPYTGSEFTISGLKSNSSYIYGIYTSDFRCKYKLLYTLYANIPAYNKYHNDSLCSGIEDYKLCRKWANISYSYDEWKKEVIKYKESLNKVTTNEEEQVNKTLIERIIEEYGKVYYIVLPIIIIVGGLTIIIYNKKRALF